MIAFNRTVILRYRKRVLASGTVNLSLEAVRWLAYKPADWGLLNVDAAAGVRHVKGVKKLRV